MSHPLYNEAEADMSKGDIMAASYRWLEENPDAPLPQRACFAITALTGGWTGMGVRWGDVAELIDEPVQDVVQAMLALKERRGH